MATRVEIPIVVLNDQSPYNPVAGASCTITDRSTAKTVTVFSDSGATNGELTQPLTSDAAGRISGWLPRGAYECTVTVPGRTPYSEPFDAAPGKDGGIDTAWIAGEAVTGEKISSTVKDAAAATPSLRTLGTSSTSAAAGNDSRLSDERIPTSNSVTTAKIVNENVTTEKLADSAVTSRKFNPTSGLAISNASPTLTTTPTTVSNCELVLPKLAVATYLDLIVSARYAIATAAETLSLRSVVFKNGVEAAETLWTHATKGFDMDVTNTYACRIAIAKEEEATITLRLYKLTNVGVATSVSGLTRFRYLLRSQ
jgi:hypothetical protein